MKHRKRRQQSGSEAQTFRFFFWPPAAPEAEAGVALDFDEAAFFVALRSRPVISIRR